MYFVDVSAIQNDEGRWGLNHPTDASQVAWPVMPAAASGLPAPFGKRGRLVDIEEIDRAAAEACHLAESDASQNYARAVVF